MRKKMYTVEAHVEVMIIRKFKKYASSPQEAIELVRQEPKSYISDKLITEKTNWIEIGKQNVKI